MKNSSSIAAAAACLAVLSSAIGAQAATSTATCPVTATVNANCTISATALAFGNYDPLTANASAALNAQNTITLACVKGVAPAVGLDTGSNGTKGVGTTRAMAGAGTFLSYELYQDAARTKVWGNSGAGLDTLAAVSSTAPFGVTVYGSVPGGQAVGTGAYSDTITATVNF